MLRQWRKLMKLLLLTFDNLIGVYTSQVESSVNEYLIFWIPSENTRTGKLRWIYAKAYWKMIISSKKCGERKKHISYALLLYGFARSSPATGVIIHTPTKIQMISQMLHREIESKVKPDEYDCNCEDIFQFPRGNQCVQPNKTCSFDSMSLTISMNIHSHLLMEKNLHQRRWQWFRELICGSNRQMILFIF